MSGWKLVTGDSNGSDFEHPNGKRALFDHVEGTVSDGFHTFDELYRHRMLLCASLFNAWDESWELHGVTDIHKSLRHSSGELCFGGGWFIVVAQLPTGQISYHYPEKDWDLFDIPVRDLPAEFDGHTADDVDQRLEAFLRGER